MLQFFKCIFIILINLHILNLQADQIDYLKASDRQIQSAFNDEKRLKYLCNTPKLHIIEVRDFRVYDISKEFFLVKIFTPCPENFINEIKESAPSLNLIMEKAVKLIVDKKVEYPDFYNTRMEISITSIKNDPENKSIITFLARSPFRVPASIYPELVIPKKTVNNEKETTKYLGHFYYPITFKSNSKEIVIKFNKPFSFFMPKRLIGINQQPEALKITPNGGIPGTMISVIGKNFGDDQDKIQIEISKASDPKIIFSYKIHPFYLGKSDDGKNHQILKFNLPDLSSDEARLGKISFFNTIYRLRILVNSRPSDYQNLSIVPGNWKFQTIVMSNILMLVLLAVVSIFIKKLNFLPNILLDKATNTYSLPRLQAFMWTIVIIGCYFNLAISHALLIADGLIPQFNESLIMLMTISFGGLIGSEASDLKKIKTNALRPPVFSDFFLKGGKIDFPKLQLFAFTIGSIFVYLYMVFSSNSLESLPDVPNSLIALMGASQGGFIGSKLVGGKLTIAFITPSTVRMGERKIVTILGSGFVPETKILFDGFPAIRAEFLNQNSLICFLPKFASEGDKKMGVIPPNGNIVYIEKAITVKGEISLEESSEGFNVLEEAMKLKAMSIEELKKFLNAN